MSNILKLFHRNIIAQITLLLCLLLVSYAVQMFGHSLLDQRRDHLHLLLNNEQQKLELSYLLQKNLLAVDVKLHQMSNAESVSEIETVLTLLHGYQKEILNILAVLELEGEKTLTYTVNFGNEEIASKKLNYSNVGHLRIDREIIELKAKLEDLDQIIVNFKAVVATKIAILQNRDLFEIVGSDREVRDYFKGIELLFSQIVENSNRIHFSSQKEMERIQGIYNRLSQTYTRVESILSFCVVAFILLMGWVVLRSIKRILHERDSYQQELQNTNENLEKIVQQRTASLNQEISERKSAQLQIKQDADFLNNVIESLVHPFYVIDVENYAIVLANSAARNSANRTCTTCYALTHDRDKPCTGPGLPCALQQVKQSQAPVVVEHSYINLQGEEVAIEVHGYPVFDRDGKLIQMIEYRQDISTKRNAEKALKQLNTHLEETVERRTKELEEQILQRKKAQLTLIKSERHFRRLIENISDIMTILDVDGRILYTSPAVEKLLGIAAEKLVGMHVSDLVLPEDLKHLGISALYEAYKGSVPMEYRLKDRRGSIHVIESLIQKFQQDDGRDAYILSSRDITIRKVSEEETRKLKMVVEQSPSSVVITDVDGIIEYVNPAFEEITGYSFAEAVGLNPRILQSGFTPKLLFKQLWSTIKAGKIWQGEFINKKKNGELYDESVLVIPIRNTQEEITHFVAVKENITELKKAQEQAEMANQAKSNFLSHMSHELRTPLNAINGFSQLMLKSKKNPLNEKQRNMTAQIHTAGQHLLQLINEILDLARIESGEFALALESLEPHIVIDDCLSLTAAMANEKSISMTCRYAGKDLPLVKADLTRMKQVVLNILSNAIKYNRESGTVTIDIETENPEFLRFVIEDTGIGIAQEKQKDLFVPFTRAVENASKIEGTGIGMTITRQLVEKMGGEIGFQSELNQGSLFWFTLPVDQESFIVKGVNSLEVSNNEATPVASRQQKLVLYVEDDPTNIIFMQDLFLELENLRLVVASTGEEGVSMASENRPDLILMDLDLPDIDGFQALRRIKKNPELTSVPVLAVSADAMEKTIKRVHTQGFNSYIPKPIDVDLLYTTMTDLLKD
ncbi:PAS domain S-box-containing protein [Desulfuromusa kysingii]|uniref:histidine kinase n=1 Tax=Desulfuromusa kysingii TaxID=37625 RepID=A0A1H3ZES0_9BACT|nr:PAS domain S-box protein [Desulfuromusa kysingii]SEA21911.1 PAS domain S-box-containing protein [Desulfuromusa kysingii]